MSFTETDLEGFADEQFEILQEANRTVTNNALDFHRQNCVNEDKDDKSCEVNFMKAIEILIEMRVQRAMHAAMHPPVSSDVMVIEVTGTDDPRLN